MRDLERGLEMEGRKGNRLKSVFLGLGFLATLTVLNLGCDITGPDLEKVGTVGFWDGEGGCWSISTSKENFHPLELPEEFKVVGMRVRFEAERLPNMNSFCPGKVIELKKIRSAG